MIKTLRTSTLVLAAGLLVGSSAFAQLAREQARAELVVAQRTGDIASGLDGDKKLNELKPAHYPSQPATQGKTRAQVRAELIEAQRTGDIPTGLGGNMTMRELDPGRYPRQN